MEHAAQVYVDWVALTMEHVAEKISWESADGDLILYSLVLFKICDSDGIVFFEICLGNL